jgi:putative hydrolase of the HAD superfamily
MLDLSSVTTLFFDLDHTLWDFETNSTFTFKKIFEEENIPIPLQAFIEVYSPINHACWKLYRENKITHIELRNLRLEKTFNALDFDYSERLLSIVNERYIDYLSDFTHLFDGTIELLQKLQKRYEMHIITNGFDSVQYHKMRNSGLQPFFGKVFTAEQVGYKKPSPEIFEYALAQSGKTAAESIMIGDSLEADIQGALNLSMQAIHFNSHGEESHNACPMVHSLQEIEALLL